MNLSRWTLVSGVGLATVCVLVAAGVNAQAPSNQSPDPKPQPSEDAVTNVRALRWQAKTKALIGRFNEVEFADGTVMRDTQTGADDGGRADTEVRP
jgi:hypothetical protein